MRQMQMEEDASSYGLPGEVDPRNRERSPLVEKRQSSPTRERSPSPISVTPNVLGCVGSGVGSHHQLPPNIGSLDRGGSKNVNKPQRIKGNKTGPSSIRVTSSKQERRHPLRQHHSPIIPQEGRGYKVGASQPRSSSDTRLGGVKRDFCFPSS